MHHTSHASQNSRFVVSVYWIVDTVLNLEQSSTLANDIRSSGEGLRFLTNLVSCIERVCCKSADEASSTHLVGVATLGMMEGWKGVQAVG